MVAVKRGIVLFAMLSVLHGCSFLAPKSAESEAEGSDRQTIRALNDNGLHLEAYNASLWGFILSAESVAQPASIATSAADEDTHSQFAVPEPSINDAPGSKAPPVDPSVPPANSDASSKPGSNLTSDVPVKGMIDDSLIAEDVNTVFDAPSDQYGYIAVRKCLRLTTVLEEGLTADGIYCLQVPQPEIHRCESPRRLIRGREVRESLNNITNENLDLGSVLTSKLGFTYDTKQRIWAKQSDGITIMLTPLRIAALSLEGACGGGGPGDPGQVDGGYPSDKVPSGLTQARLELSSRLAIPMKIAVDSQNRTYIASASAGTEPEYSMRIGRFLTTGEPDSSFGAGGYVELSQLQKSSAGYVVRLDESRNRIYVAGYQGSEWSRVIVALNMSGQLDTAWGEDGVLAANMSLSSFVLDAEGRVVFLEDRTIKRLDHQGKADHTFGEKGSMAIDLDEHPAAFALYGDSFFILTESNSRNTVDLYSGKISAPTLKKTSVVGLPGDDMQSNQLAVSSGMVVAYGRKFNSTASTDGYWVAAFNHDGDLMPGFGSDGVVRSNEGSSQNDVVFDSADSFWMSGWNGSIRHFDKTGTVTKHVFSNYIYLGADALALAPDGHLVGAYVAHGGGEMFRASPEFIATFK